MAVLWTEFGILQMKLFKMWSMNLYIRVPREPAFSRAFHMILMQWV